MEENSGRIEDRDKKEMRKRVLQIASEECDSIQTEIQDWRRQGNDRTGNNTAKARGGGLIEDKIAEIEKKISRKRKGINEEKEGEDIGKKLEIEAKMRSLVLNQEILVREKGILVEKHEIEVRCLKERIRGMEEEIGRVRSEVEGKNEEKIRVMRSEMQKMSEKLTEAEGKVSEKENQGCYLREQVQDREKIIELLEKRVFSLEAAMVGYKEKEFEYNNCRVFLEKEKKRREIAESEYKMLVDEVKISTEDLKFQYDHEVETYKETIKQLEGKLILFRESLSNIYQESSPFISSPSDPPIDPAKPPAFPDDSPQTLKQTISTLKEKSKTLLDTFFPALNDLRADLSKLKSETALKLLKLKKSFDRTTKELISKYNDALEASNKSLDYFRSRLESSEGKRHSKVRFCKPSKE
jgi:hypothetical protein